MKILRRKEKNWEEKLDQTIRRSGGKKMGEKTEKTETKIEAPKQG